MPASRRGATLVALMACLLPAAPGARADERVLMPYSCETAGGRPLLTPTPGQDNGHRIVGRREQRNFTACSPANPRMCRRWTVYRFDLDCDGARVPWVEVVAAANEAAGRARLADGRLQLRMPPRWSLAPDDPCANESALDGLFADRRQRRYCAERLARAPPAVVEMPSGFAPLLGFDAIFVDVPANVARYPPAPPPARQPGADQAPPIPRAEPPRSPPAGEAMARPTPAEPPPPAPSHGLSEARPKAQPPAPAAGRAEGAAPTRRLRPRDRRGNRARRRPGGRRSPTRSPRQRSRSRPRRPRARFPRPPRRKRSRRMGRPGPDFSASASFARRRSPSWWSSWA